MSSSDLQPPALSLGRLLNRTSSTTNALANSMLAEHGLSLPQWVLMSALWRRDGLLVSELSTYSGSLLPATSRIVARMADAGLVERRPDTKDRRTVHVHLTEKGRALSHLRDFYLDVNKHLLDGFEETDKETLFNLLERALANAAQSR